MIEILLAAVAANEVSAVVANGQLGNENQHFLTLVKDFLAESENVGQLLTCRLCLFFQVLGVIVKSSLDQFEGCSAIRRLVFFQDRQHQPAFCNR